MAVQRGSLTDWRYRAVRDDNWLRSATSAWLLTTPNSNLVGRQEFPDSFPAANRRAVVTAMRTGYSQQWVTGSAPSWILTTPNFNLIAGWQEFPPYLFGHNAKARVTAQRNGYSQNWVTGSTPSWILTTPNANLTVSQQEYPPFFPIAWRRRFTDQGYVQGTSDSILQALAMGANQYDWPNPTSYLFLAKIANVNRGFVQGMPTPIFNAPQPFIQTDWPVPKGRPPLNRGWALGTSPLLLAVPFNQTDWPVPKGAPPREVRGTAWGTPTVVLQSLIMGFNQYDWPVPKGYDQRAREKFRGPQDTIYLALWSAEGFPARYAPIFEANAQYASTVSLEAQYEVMAALLAQYEADPATFSAQYEVMADSNARYAPTVTEEARYG